ncbi:AMP-binding protein [Streptomyces sp. TRM72054]|uniref:(2,3-dihydroxybenzoyl)adenylate synthase n=1 Tax=Streptomyces sp. TRM72054 TaxID=2870562 RepID=UPI001C8CCD31|nr:AMP-binding protein [Streptomyces sp. TRM72054]MBX9396594.1 AMP-binding protein [Streptomyces sp. TRM72054]
MDKPLPSRTRPEGDHVLDGCTPWPDDFAARYREAGHWRGETFDQLLRTWTRAHPHRTALVHGERRLDRADLERAADGVARRLAGLGVGPGDRVVLQLPNVPEFFTVFFGLQRLGAIPVLTLPLHRRSEIVHLCRLSQAVAYVVPDVHQGFDHRELAAEVLKECPDLRHVLVVGDPGVHLPLDGPGTAGELPPASGDASEVALLLVSGGTTGLPKLIPRTHDDYAYNVRASAELCGFALDTVYLAALPVAHNFALGCPGVLGALHAGGTAVLTDEPDPDVAFALVERERVTATALVPPTARIWAAATEWGEADLSSLRLLQVGGARLLPEYATQVRAAFGPVLQQVFGMAEGLLNYTEPDADEQVVVHTQGRPLSPDDEIRIVDEHDRDVPPGTTGRLLTRGPYTLRGYYRADEHNATAFTADGYYRTGDLVRRTATGHLVVEGRVKEQINRGGDKVAAAEVEEQLTHHPAVLDTAVVPIPDDLLGERTCAFVVTRPGATAPDRHEAAAFLRKRGLAPYKIPDRIEALDALPVTAVGKTDKKALTALAHKLAAEGSVRKEGNPRS